MPIRPTCYASSGEFPAKEFRETINNHIELEAFTRCGICSRKFHQICVMWHKQLGTPFICQMCNKDNRIQLPPNKFTSESAYRGGRAAAGAASKGPVALNPSDCVFL